MANLSEDIQCADSDTRPPMLDRTDFASWKQGLPKDIYTLINYYTDANDIWDNVKMLLEGFELTKEDRESQLMQLNSKFFNYMLLEWGRFVTAVKLNKGLRGSNYDWLYAYLKQHEAHANENKMMLDRFTQHTIDPLTLMSNVLHQQYYSQSSTTPPSIYVQQHFADNTQLDLGLSPTDNLIENLTNTLALLTQSYKTYLPQTNNQLRTLSNTRNQATVHDDKVVIQNVQGRLNRGQWNNARGACAAGYGGAKNKVGNANPGQARQIKYYNCNAQENGVALDEEQLLFITGEQDNAIDEDEDVDEHRPSYDLDILSEVPDHDNYQDVVCKHHEVHEMHDDVQPNYVVDSHTDYENDSNMILYDQYVKDNVVSVVQSNVSSVPNDAYMMIINEMHELSALSASVNRQHKVVNVSLTAKLATYKEQVELYESQAKFELTEREQKIKEQLRIVITDRNIKEENLKKELHSVKMQLTSAINHNKSMPALYNGHEIIKTNHVSAIVHNSDNTLEIAEFTRKKMNDKMKDPECVKKKVKIAPHDYSKENYLASFTPQKQLTPEQIFWSKDLLKMKAKALKEQTTASRPIKVLTVKHDEIEQKILLIAYDNLIADCLSKDVFYTATDYVLTVSRFSYMHEAFNAAQKQNHKSNCVTMPAVKSKVLALGMYVIDVEPIVPPNRNNKEVHLDYLRRLKESVATLCEIVEEARVEKPLDSSLTSACLYIKHSQELVEYVIGTFPNDFNKGDKHIASIHVFRKKRVTFIDPCETYTNNTLTHVKQQTMNKTNEPVIPSIGVKGATAASGSKPRSNTKKDKTFPAKSDMKKVEVHTMNNKSSVKRKNRVDSSISNKRTVINSNSNFVCKTLTNA
nr:hypothetical protein [Tanacetum cinerariifolium]